MSKILYIWEWGNGWGHLAKAEPLLKLLADHGHTITLAVPKPDQAELFFKDTRFEYQAIPRLPRSQKMQSRASRCFPELMVEQGYGDPIAVASALQEWQVLLAKVDPALIMADFSFTVPLAANAHEIPHINLGTGFTCPPTKAWQFAGPAHLSNSEYDPNIEEHLLQSFQKALTLAGLKPLRTWEDYWSWCETLLLTLPELDAYPRPLNTNYWGPILPTNGIEPEWPPGQGPKIFLYIHPFPGLDQILDLLATMKARVLVLERNYPAEARVRYKASNMRFVSTRLNAAQVVASCDGMIMNAGHGLISASLLAGKPSLLLPIHLEQEILCWTLAQQKLAAAAFPMTIKNWEPILDAFLTRLMPSPQLSSFTQKYRNYSGVKTVHSIVERIECIIR